MTEEPKPMPELKPYWKRLPDEVILNEMTAYKGWRFIFDEKGIAHHVPDHETLKAMCDVYYKRADLAQKPLPDAIDGAYKERNQVVAALAKCFPSGIGKTVIDGWDEAWHNCVYIDLPTGQASWHYHDRDAYLFEGLPQYQGKWDGHSTPEKYERLHALQVKPLPDDVREAVEFAEAALIKPAYHMSALIGTDYLKTLIRAATQQTDKEG